MDNPSTSQNCYPNLEHHTNGITKLVAGGVKRKHHENIETYDKSGTVHVYLSQTFKEYNSDSENEPQLQSFQQSDPLQNPIEYNFHDYARSSNSPIRASFNLENGLEVFSQNENCFDTSPNLTQCHECEKDALTSKYTCRFYNFRKISVDSSKAKKANGFLDPAKDPTQDDIKLWKGKDESLTIGMDSRNYIVQFLARVFCELSEYESNIQNKWGKKLIWKRPIIQVREQCDVCATSLFNLHWTCIHCGTNSCSDCYRERNDGQSRWKPKTKIDKELRDKFFWLKCMNKTGHELALTQIIVDSELKILNSLVHQLCIENQIATKCACELRMKKVSRSSLKDNFVCAIKRLKYRSRKSKREMINTNVNCKLIAKNRIIKFEEPSESADSYLLFQDQWERGLPVIVANANRTMKKEIWTPKYFSQRFGNDKHEMIDCTSGYVINRVAMRVFWNGFESIAKRIPKSSSHKTVLKLKDWPTSDDFADVMTEHFNDLMQAVPMSAYTTRNGKFNLTRYLPNFFSQPDLGPKMYSAYSQSHPAQQGSTNLHLDMSDAVNVMIHVSRPEDFHLAQDQYSQEAMKHALEIAGADDEDIAKVSNVDNIKTLPGAIWHIWEALHADGIRKMLRNEAKLKGRPMQPNDDPIHDQNWYIDQSMREKLAEDGIVGYTIVQYEGDSIFIPAGAPHQVLNVLDCIKVALDFVAPENIVECVNLTEEFRTLSSRHQNHEDKLQIKNIMYHTLKNLVSAQR